ncbi:unnamed protein product, partial [Adineta steineri]
MEDNVGDSSVIEDGGDGDTGITGSDVKRFNTGCS